VSTFLVQYPLRCNDLIFVPFPNCISAALEELSVRANLALNQKKFSLENISAEGYDVTELEDEYNSLCAQVDKVTLKFFMATVESGKLESALDLTNRLHLEKSFDIAVTIAERMNHRNLSDRIEEVKDRKFAMNAENSDILHDDEGYPPGDSTQTYKETPRVPQSRQISPETQNLPGMKRPLRHVADNTDDIVEPPTKKKTINPFAKKRLESPARPSFSPAKESPARVGISRRSQFSAKSREISKVSKKLL
jgi:chromosome transmission fidelity protein 4